MIPIIGLSSDDEGDGNAMKTRATSPVSRDLLSPERKKPRSKSQDEEKKRGRGRPTTTGRYVRLAAAKELMQQREKEMAELRVE